MTSQLDRRNGTDVLPPESAATATRWGRGGPSARPLDDWFARMAPAPGLLIDVTETDEAYRVRAEVPGIRPEDLDLRLDDGVLTLAATKRDGRGDAEERTLSERSFGEIRRSIRLPRPVDAERVEAVHAYGVVTITLPKAHEARPRRIEVRTG